MPETAKGAAMASALFDSMRGNHVLWRPGEHTNKPGRPALTGAPQTVLGELSMMKPFGAKAAEVVESLHVIHEALGFAKIEGRKDISDACGRLLMERFGGRNRNVNTAADWELVKDYLHGPQVVA